MPDILVPLSPFIMVIFIVGFATYFDYRKRRAVLETVRAAAEHGTPLTPEIIHALGMKPPAPDRGLGCAFILLAVAAATVVLGVALAIGDGDWELIAIFTGIAAFPGFIGAALLLLARSRRDAPDHRPDDQPGDRLGDRPGERAEASF